VGQIKLSSPDHIALLVHRTFNVSIPRHHIPVDHWEFEYGAAENDPEFGAGIGGDEDGEAEGQGEEGGRWVHSITGEKLGSPDGFLEFTVIG
jgi:DNA-directed RNA polymerase I subunit RPA43